MFEWKSSCLVVGFTVKDKNNWNKSFASRNLMKPCYLAPPKRTIQL